MYRNIYFVFIILVLLMLAIQKVFIKDNKLVVPISLTVIYSGLVSLRNAYSVGVDLVRYNRHYLNIGNLSFKDSLFYSNDSYAYYLLNYICNKLNCPFQLFVSIISVSCVAIFAWYVYKHSNEPVISFLVYAGMGCYTFLFSGLRQSLAMSLILIAIDRFKAQKTSQTVVWIIIAFLFHPTAIIVVPVLLVSKIKITGPVLLGYSLAIGILYVVRMPVSQLLISIYSDEYVNKYESKGSIGSTAIFILLILISYILIKYDSEEEYTDDDNFDIHSLMIMLSIQICSSFAYSFTRLNLYYMLFAFPTIVPKLWILFEKHNTKALHLFIKLASYVIIYFMMISQFLQHIEREYLLDYRFFWE